MDEELSSETLSNVADTLWQISGRVDLGLSDCKFCTLIHRVFKNNYDLMQSHKRVLNSEMGSEPLSYQISKTDISELKPSLETNLVKFSIKEAVAYRYISIPAA